MASRYFSPFSEKRVSGGKGPNPGMGSSSPSPGSDKSANWPGLPGKSGPDRSAGTRKCKCHAVSKGI